MRSVVMTVAVGLAFASGCTTLLGVDGYRAVDCTTDCGAPDGGGASGTDGATPARDDGGALDATLEASETQPDVGCPSSVAVSVALIGGSSVVTSDPPLYRVSPGQIETRCIGAGTRLRLLLGAGTARWTGTVCKDGPDGDRCEFQVSVDATVTATVQ